MSTGEHLNNEDDQRSPAETSTGGKVTRSGANSHHLPGKLDSSAGELSQVLAHGHSALWGAFVLGHHRNMVRVWQVVAYSVPFDAAVWEELPMALREIRHAMSAVAGRLSSGQVAMVDHLAERIQNLNATVRPEALAKYHGNDPQILSYQQLPGRESWTELSLLLDGMLRSDDSLRLWYEFGEAISNCDLALNEKGRLPDLERLIGFAGKLDELGVFEIPMLRQLSEVDVKEGLQTSVEQIIRIAVVDQDLTGRVGVDLNQAINNLYLIVAKALESGCGVAVTLQHDSKNRERDRWIYEQVQAGGGEIAYPSIIKKLVQVALANGWTPIESVGGLKRAAAAYAKRYGQPVPTRRKQGRPKKSD